MNIQFIPEFNRCLFNNSRVVISFNRFGNGLHRFSSETKISGFPVFLRDSVKHARTISGYLLSALVCFGSAGLAQPWLDSLHPFLIIHVDIDGQRQVA